MEEENWCMQWSDEVLPEIAMIPDRGVFLRATSAYSQAVATRERCQAPLSREHEIHEVLSYVETQGRFPGRLKLPFTLSPFVRRVSPEQVFTAASNEEALFKRVSPEQMCIATSNEEALFRRERKAYDGPTTCLHY